MKEDGSKMPRRIMPLSRDRTTGIHKKYLMKLFSEGHNCPFSQSQNFFGSHEGYKVKISLIPLSLYQKP
jgi:hypothetical protein